MTSRHRSAFSKKTLERAYTELQQELGRLGAKSVVISTNVPLRNDGRPYSNPGRLDDPGAVAYFHLASQPYAMPIDKWLTVEENLWALALHIEAMRAMQRYGVGSVSQAFAGFKALPPSTEEDWWYVLNLDRNAASREQVEARYKVLARSAHPDAAGGSHDAMARINAARSSALFELSGQGA